MWIFSQHSRYSGKKSCGFTLIELLVVSAIVVIITSLLLFRQSKLNSSTLLRSLGYSIALSMRQAQVYGTSVVGTQTGGTTVFASGYGLYFNSTSPNNYILFADLNNNGAYNTTPTDETVKVFTLDTGYTISEFCALQGISKACSGADDTTGTPITSFTTVFKRPNPDACFSTSNASSACATGVSPQFSSGYVQIRSADGTTRSITISSSGQIMVQAPNTLP